MEKLKELYNEKRVRAFAATIARANPRFAEKEFLRMVLPLIAALEMKDRVRLLSRALRDHLPGKMSIVLPGLLRSLRSQKNPRGLTGFLAWPLNQFVEDYALEEPSLALAALAKITEEMSAEFAIRPFLRDHRKLVFSQLNDWVNSENVHLRRLVSEGTRPRLPWGQRLRDFQADPTICLPLLKKLRHDPALYVRKSVANHLNDIAKDHPAQLVAELTAWREECGADPHMQWIIRHALRTLVKAGDRGALALLGYETPSYEKAKLKVSPPSIKLGSLLNLEFSALPKKSGRWNVDYALHLRKKDGRMKPKVFKWKSFSATAGDPVRLTKRHSIREISTRKYYPGAQEVEVLVNGKSAARATFRLASGSQPGKL